MVIRRWWECNPCMGPAHTEQLMREAGFSRFEVIDIKQKGTHLFFSPYA